MLIPKSVIDQRRRLNYLIRRYAREKNIDFRRAWNDFKKAYGELYHTDLEQLISNFCSHTKKKSNIPDYLESAGKLPDALRVMDRLLS